MISLSVALALVVLTPPPVPTPPDVGIAAARHLLARRGASALPLCIVVDGGDPPPGLMQLPHDPGLTLLPGGACRYEIDENHRDRALGTDGRPVEFLTLGPYKRKDSEHADVDYEFRAGSWTGHGSTLHLELRNGAWYVLPSEHYEWQE